MNNNRLENIGGGVLLVTIAALEREGYIAWFEWSFDHAKELIDSYLK